MDWFSFIIGGLIGFVLGVFVKLLMKFRRFLNDEGNNKKEF